MTDNTSNDPVTTARVKMSEIDRLEALALKIAKSIVKNPLTDEAAAQLHKITSLIYSTITHSQTINDVSNKVDSTSEAEVNVP